MKLSERWLREWIDPPVDTAALGDSLTSLGLEVDEIESADPGFDGVLVARIDSVAPHPNADRLRVCQVNTGGDTPLEVVCGAPNARVGLLTALATIGGRLPDGTRIKASKLRGMRSEGMLCSAAELGLADESGGILELADDMPLGARLQDALELDDHVLTIELTPDRGDCLSVRGVARDLSARYQQPLTRPSIAGVKPTLDDRVSISVATTSACARYTGRVLRGLDLSAISPLWMRERLRRSGMRAINPAVDVTNYVMLSLGQPMHAFDLDKLQGGIQVRLPEPAERLTLLDGREVALEADTSVIADDSGAIGIAGVMGGQSTAVEFGTTSIYFESALFLADPILGQARRYGLHTESSHRFERGVDPEGQLEALEYATELLVSIAGGEAGPVDDWRDADRMPCARRLHLRRSRLTRVLGTDIDPREVQQRFESLGIDSAPEQSEGEVHGWSLAPPAFRHDLKLEEDFIAEVGRLHGFDRLPRSLPTHAPAIRPLAETRLSPLSLKQALCARDYQEVVTLSFVDEARQSVLRPDLPGLALRNPISSDLGVMRTTLLSGLVEVLRRNLARQQSRVRVFETGLRFVSSSADDRAIDPAHGDEQQVDPDLYQQSVLAGLVSGPEFAENWNRPQQPATFHSVKADIEALLPSGTALVLEASDLAALHPGQRAAFSVDGRAVGYLGVLHPEVQRSLDLDQSAVVFEFSLEALRATRVPSAQPVSRQPSLRRDLAVVVDEAVSWESLRQVVLAHAPDSLRELRLFDVYRGDALGKGKKSMALCLILQDFSRTLEESEVEASVDRIVTALRTELAAERRA